MIGYIYGLYKNNNENDIFYIGSSLNPAKRIISHRQNFPFYIYYSRIEYCVLEEFEFDDIKDLRKNEYYWIQQFNAWGFKLRNYNLGYGFDVISNKLNAEYYSKVL